jgi:hypothetical protein
MLSDILPVKGDWTKVLVIESKLIVCNCIAVRFVIVVVPTSISEPSECWVEIPILSEDSIIGGVKIDWIENENKDYNDVLVTPLIVMYTLFTGSTIMLYEQDKELELLVTAEQIGLVIKVLLLYRSLDQVRGNYKTIFVLELIWFLGFRETTNLDLVRIVAP